MLKSVTITLLFAAAAAQDSATRSNTRRVLKGKSNGGEKGNMKSKKSPKSGDKDYKYVDLYVTNLSFQQPYGGFFAAVHNAYADPIFTIGYEATPELADLAENGDPSKLVDLYNGEYGVLGARSFSNDGPLFGGQTFIIPEIPYTEEYPYISIASMAINTNDCFVALSGVKISPGTVYRGPGYDSGSEENNELCSSIPGPACPEGSGNVASGNGEGFVHVHRGFFGVGDLPAKGYDWRNPMLQVEVSNPYYR